MKKLLTILSVSTILTATTVSVVACGVPKMTLSKNVDEWKSNYHFQNYNAQQAVAFNKQNYNLSGNGMFINKNGETLSSRGLADGYDHLKPSKNPWEHPGEVDFTPGFAILNKSAESMIYYYEKNAKNANESFLSGLTGKAALDKINDNFTITYSSAADTDEAVAKVFNEGNDMTNLRYCKSSGNNGVCDKDNITEMSDNSGSIYQPKEGGVVFSPLVQWSFTQGGQGSVATSAVVYFKWTLELKEDHDIVIDEETVKATVDGFYSKEGLSKIDFIQGWQVGLPV